MIYIGIDPSFTRTCVSIFENDLHTTTEFIEFDSKKKQVKLYTINYPLASKTKTKTTQYNDDFSRIEIVYDYIWTILNGVVNSRPDEAITFRVAIEVPMGGHMGAGAKMDRIFAAVYLACKHYNNATLSVKLYVPSQIKKFLTGKGNAKKEIMIKEAYKKFGFEASTNDEVDAYAIGKLLISESTNIS